MKFEGEHRAIPLRGIERAFAHGVAKDGGMEEVINMIPRNGSYVPYSPKTVTQDYSAWISSQTKMVRVHHTSTGDNTIIVFNNYYLVNPIMQGGTLIGRVDNVTVNEIVFIGNRMDLSTSTGIEHWLWKNGEYVNLDDLESHTNDVSDLPSISFKVSRGIYDGSKVYAAARYVKTHKHFTDANTANCDQDEISAYVRKIDSVGSDAMALLNSIRQIGGITGYTLVAAAWRVKGSGVSNPKYIMASPVLLMGAPEIYMKDGQFEHSDKKRYAKPSDTYMLDMFDYDGSEDKGGDNGWKTHWGDLFDNLWNMSDSDDREIGDLAEGENVFIDLQETADPCVIRTIESRKQLPVTAGQGHKAAFALTTKTAICQPALYSQKFAMYDHVNMLGTDENDAEYKARRVTHASANVLYYKLNSALPDKYKDEVDRLCIFVSPIVSPYKTNGVNGIRFESDYKEDRKDIYDGFFFANYRNDGDYGVHNSACGGSFSPIMKSSSEIRDELKNIAGLYKVAEVQLTELGVADTWLKVNLSDGRLATDRMVQNSDTMLKLSDLQPIGFSEGYIFGYNERLHVYNFKKDQVYRLPYKSLSYYGGEGQYEESSESYCNFHIEIEDSNGSKIAHKLTRMKGTLNPLISCADIDAKQIRLLKYYQGPPRYGISTYTPVVVGGIVSGFMSASLHPIGVSAHNTTDEGLKNAYFNDDIKPDSYAWGKNEIRVSEVGSIVFEPSKSYKIGHGEIIALARLSMGLSQDNYSKYPLVVFCTDGVYTLSVDTSGQYAYGTQDPLSRVVCSNANGICEIDGAILFPTEYGLHMVTVDGVKPIVLQVNGEPCNYPDSSHGLQIYQDLTNHQKIVELLGSISVTDFIDDIQSPDTYLRYLHAINSVVVYNKSLSYSYMIDLTHWTVTKLEQNIICDDMDYPKQIFRINNVRNNSLQSIQFDYHSGQNNTQCLFVTRPILLDSQHLKTTYRVVMRGVFKYNPNVNEDCYAGLYVFGSLDGNNWKCIGGEEKLLSNNRFNDIGCRTHRDSVRYLMVVFAANLSQDSHIDGLEITSDVKYNNKLK